MVENINKCLNCERVECINCQRKTKKYKEMQKKRICKKRIPYVEKYKHLTS